MISRPFFIPVIIQSFKEIHKVRGRRYIRRLLYRADLQFAETADLLCRKSSPVQYKRCTRNFSVRTRAVYLAPVSICMAPEMVPPRTVKFFQSTVFFLQPLDGMLPGTIRNGQVESPKLPPSSFEICHRITLFRLPKRSASTRSIAVIFSRITGDV